MLLGGLVFAAASRDWGWPEPSRERLAWEPWFYAGLALVGLAMFTWQLGSLPQGADYSEGWLAHSAQALRQGPYAVVDSDPRTPWPTLMHYLGLASTAVLGPSASAWRLPAALWGLATLASFAFAVRLLFSPGSAAAASLLWLAFHLQLVYARRFLPVVMAPLPVFLGLGALTLGLRTGKRRWFLLAGLAIGSAMHGYVAGRAIPIAFLVWSAWAWAAKRERDSLGGRLAWTWGAALLVAGPVLWALAAQPGSLLLQRTYSPGAGPELQSSWKARLAQVPAYAGLFRVRGNAEYPEDDMLGRPALDAMAGALFVLGLALCLARPKEGNALFLLTVLTLGLLPALYALIGEAPFARRAIAAFPAVFLMAALGLQRLRQAWPRLSEGRWALMACTLAAVFVGLEWRHYSAYAQDPDVRRFLGAGTYLARREMERFPSAQADLSASLYERSATVPFFMSGPPPRLLRSAEEFLFVDPGRDQLLLAAPYLGALGGLLKEAYPHALTKSYRESAYADQRFLEERLAATDFNAFDPDMSAPDQLLHCTVLPSADIAQRQGWLDLDHGRPFRGGAPPGQALRLGALLLLPDEGALVRASSAWPGWTLSWRGQPLAWERPFHLDGRVAFLELRGRVPQGASGRLPWDLRTAAGQPLRTLAWRPTHGLRATLFTRDPNGAGSTRLHLLLPAFRAESALGLAAVGARFEGVYHPRQSGLYQFRLPYPGAGSGTLWAAGSKAFEQAEDEKGLPKAVALVAGQACALRVDYPLSPAKSAAQAMQIEVLAPGAPAWAPLGYQDLTEPDL